MMTGGRRKQRVESIPLSKLEKVQILKILPKRDSPIETSLQFATDLKRAGEESYSPFRDALQNAAVAKYIS